MTASSLPAARRLPAAADTTVLWVVRHGETEENVAGILQGHLPGHLTPRGIAQAQHLAVRLQGIPFSACYVSDLARTVATARLLQPVVGCLPMPTPLLRERDWGSLTGRKIAEVRDSVFPDDVETVEAMAARARDFVAHLLTHHRGATVLAVTHGLFARCLRATLTGRAIRDIPRMGNAEACRLVLGPDALSLPSAVTEEMPAAAE